MTSRRVVGAAAAVEAAIAAPYHRVFAKQDDGGYWALILELEGVFGAGGSIAEANETLEEALADWVALELENGHTIPEPLGIDDFSGRVTFRIPPTLHYNAALRAQLEGVSLNRLMSLALAQFVGEGQPRLREGGLREGEPAALALSVNEEPAAYASGRRKQPRRGSRGGSDVGQ